VFGESVLNDAVAIVLFQTLQKSAGSPLSWATLPFLGANFAFIGFGSMAIGALRQGLFFWVLAWGFYRALRPWHVNAMPV